jgi:hypothetical protein
LTLLAFSAGLFFLGILGEVLATMFFSEQGRRLGALLPWVWLTGALAAAGCLAGWIRTRRAGKALGSALPSFFGFFGALAWLGLLAAGSFVPFSLPKEDPKRGMDLLWRGAEPWMPLAATSSARPLDAVWPRGPALPPGCIADGPVERHEGDKAVQAFCEPQGIDRKTFREVRRVWIASMNAGACRLLAYEDPSGTHIALHLRRDRIRRDPAAIQAMMQWFRDEIAAPGR